MFAPLGMSDRTLARFAASVGPPTVSGCREWLKGRHKQGYGLFTWWDVVEHRPRTIRAHKAAFWLATGRKPAGHVCHTCDNEPCCEPSHLYDGTDQTNKDDSVRRDRHARGTRCHSAKLTDADVLAIRAEWARTPRPTQLDIGSRYGISGVMVGLIVNGRNWRHLL